MSASTEQLNALNGLIESELGAVDTYRELVQACAGEAASVRNEFRQLEIDHRNSAKALIFYLGLGEVPPISSGQWKRFILATQDTFKVLDNRALMEALKDGEIRLARKYEETLEHRGLDSNLITLIESTLLPKARAQAQSINHFIAAQTNKNTTEAT